jgi:hypothetical protein
MNADNLVVALAFVLGILGILGLVVTLVALEWTSRKGSRSPADEDNG